ncbi:MAG: NYN domain-containing protein [Alphaproteobacteria bacterium]|nr:NYN domain-containing protein [Alphaproteobacteria bacterium]
MRRESEGSLLSTVFVDYDNIYLSLKRKNEEAAKRFAKDAGHWLTEIASGRLITPTNGPALTTPRRIVMNRCYGNPVPRRNSHDNSTDMNSFPFVRHHYLRAGFEVIDCPPLTAQLKNSADIRMVMDVRDYLLHDTYFDEFIILSGDADFTPVLHRLRQHARRTVIYSNDYTAAPYTAISDGEVREADLIAALTDTQAPSVVTEEVSSRKSLPNPEEQADVRQAIVTDVVSNVRQTNQPLLLEVLADRAVRTLGREKTVGTAWGGAGSFRDLLVKDLPKGIEVTEHAPHYVFDTARQDAPVEATSEPRPATPKTEQVERLATSFGDVRPEPLVPASVAGPAISANAHQQSLNQAPRAPAQQAATAPASAVAPNPAALQPPAPLESAAPPIRPQPMGDRYPTPSAAQQSSQEPRGTTAPEHAAPQAPAAEPAPAQAGAPHQAPRHAAPEPSPQPSGFAQQVTAQRPATAPASAATAQPAPQQPTVNRNPVSTQSDNASAIQKSIARIHEACQAPPISPPEYRVLFDVMAEEITENGLTGTQTLVNICERGKALGIDVSKDDARFILEVVSEADPWFEQGASSGLFASRFRNFVIARCKGSGLQLSATELDLIEAWFTGAAPRVAAEVETPAPGPGQQAAPTQPAPAPAANAQAERAQNQEWFANEPPQGQGREVEAAAAQAGDFGRYSSDDEADFPRVLRNRNRA